MQDKPVAYTGSAPYLFASYCHDDEHLVLPLALGLMNEGLNVWYDEGVHVGDEWPEVIAEHLLGSAVFVAFLSQASQDSHNCRREFNLAMQEDKPFVAVLLEEFDSTPALRMQLAGVRTIKAFEFESTEEQIDAIVRAVRDASGKDVPDKARIGRVNTETPETDHFVRREPAGGEEPEAKELAPKKRRVPSFAIGVAAFALVMCAVLFVSGGFGLWGEEHGNVDADFSYALSTAHPALSADDGVEVLFSAMKGSSISEFSSSIEAVKERLDIFAGEGSYDLYVGGDKAKAIIPEEAFEGLDRDEALEVYISRPIKLAFCDLSGSEDPINLARRDIEEVVAEDWPQERLLATGTPAGVDTRGSVVKIVLSSTFMESHGEELVKWGNDLVLRQDREYGPADSWYWSVLRGADKRSFYLYGTKDLRPSILETVVHNFTEQPLGCTLDYWVDDSDQVTWEDPGTSKRSGQYQVAFSSLKGRVVCHRYNGGDDVTPGKLLDWESALKQRLDALGIPYAIGDYRGCEREGKRSHYVVFAIEDQPVDSCIPAMMRSSTYVMLYGDGNIRVDATADSGAKPLLIEEGSDGVLRAVFRPDQVQQSYRDGLDEFFGELSPGDTVTYTFSGTVVLRGSYVGKEAGSFVLSDLTTPAGFSLDSPEGSWLVPMLEASGSTDNMIPKRSYEGCWITEGGGICSNQVDAMVPDSYVTQLKDAIAGFAPDARVWLASGMVVVSLDLAVDDSFPATAMDTAKKVLDVAGTDFKGHLGINIAFTQEKNALDERARVWVQDVYPEKTGKAQIRYDALFANGRIRQYIGDFKQILATDEYWKEKDVQARYRY